MKWWILAIHYIVATVAFAKHEVYPETLDLDSPGWMTVVSFDLTHEDDCPKYWSEIKINGVRMCGSHTGDTGCAIANYRMDGLKYNQTVGMVRGYQKGTTDGFQASHDDGLGINEAYVDGVSITIGKPRKHVWTYAVGYSSNADAAVSNCPCSVTPGPNPPSFVGEDYYCQSGNEGTADKDKYYMLPLWGGDGCTDNCCANAGSPYFHRDFPAPQDGDIEVRICQNSPRSDEGVFIDKLHITAYLI